MQENYFSLSHEETKSLQLNIWDYQEALIHFDGENSAGGIKFHWNDLLGDQGMSAQLPLGEYVKVRIKPYTSFALELRKGLAPNHMKGKVVIGSWIELFIYELICRVNNYDFYTKWDFPNKIDFVVGTPQGARIEIREEYGTLSTLG